MRILFAVSNDNITTSVVNKYQQKYKEIITSKNVYYFNAIIKELQRNKNYDAVVIGEDLEPISNNNYDAIDKFLFEKLDSISDEASKPTGEDIPVILICSDRRTQADQLLIKLFGIGIYNAIIGNDRSIDTVCNLINKPRNKKEAKLYYKVESDEITPYEHENDLDVSETEIQNILSHYRKIGLNPKKCVESFDSIADQYNETQLRIIIKFLPKEVKEILEVNSTRYQKLVSKGTVLTNGKYSPYQTVQDPRKPGNLDILTKDLGRAHLSKPVIIPSAIDIKKGNVTARPNINAPRNNDMMNNNMSNNSMSNYGMNNNMSNNSMSNYGMNNYNMNSNSISNSMNNNGTNNYMNNSMNNNNMSNTMEVHQKAMEILEKKRGRGRPRKNVDAQNGPSTPVAPMPVVKAPTSPVQVAPAPIVPVTPTQVEPAPIAQTSFEPTMTATPTPVTSTPTTSQASVVVEPKRRRGRPRKNADVQNVPSTSIEPMPVENVPTSPVQRDVESVELPSVEPIQEAPVAQDNFTPVELPSVELPPIEDTFEPIESNNNNALPGNGIDSDLESLFSLDTSNVEEPKVEEVKFEEPKAEEATISLNASNLAPPNNEDLTKTQDLNDIYSNIYGSNFNIDTAIESDSNKAQSNFDNNANYNNSLQNNFANSAENKVENEIKNKIDNKSETTVMFNGIEDFDAPSSVNLTSTNRNMQKDEKVSSNFVAGNGKLVAFVGTSKNGTSFIVNNLAQLLSQSGIRTAIIDFTKNKNSYYMFTNNDQNLIKKATNSMKELSKGKVDGVNVNKNLTVFTALPDEIDEFDANVMMQTLSNNFDIALMDCDFESEINCFANANEIYLVQSMDTFTIQPLTQFLSDLKLKNVLDESKLRIIINKYIKLKILNEKMIIGGMSKYNEPSMTLQRDLFNSQTIRYTTVPFETNTYAKYLENIAMCRLSLNGYSQNLINSLEKLRSMVYPLVSGGNKSKEQNYNKPARIEKDRRQNGQRQQFSNDINNTLNKMRTNNF